MVLASLSLPFSSLAEEGPTPIPDISIPVYFTCDPNTVGPDGARCASPGVLVTYGQTSFVSALTAEAEAPSSIVPRVSSAESTTTSLSSNVSDTRSINTAPPNAELTVPLSSSVLVSSATDTAPSTIELMTLNTITESASPSTNVVPTETASASATLAQTWPWQQKHGGPWREQGGGHWKEHHGGKKGHRWGSPQGKRDNPDPMSSQTLPMFGTALSTTATEQHEQSSLDTTSTQPTADIPSPTSKTLSSTEEAVDHGEEAHQSQDDASTSDSPQGHSTEEATSTQATAVNPLRTSETSSDAEKSVSRSQGTHRSQDLTPTSDSPVGVAEKSDSRSQEVQRSQDRAPTSNSPIGVQVMSTSTTFHSITSTMTVQNTITVVPLEASPS